MNTSLLKHEKLRSEIISFWSDWTEAKMLFSDVGEWWDEGKAEIKHIIIEYSKAVRQQINEQRVHLMNKFHRLSEKKNLSPHELEQLQRVRSDLCELASQRLKSSEIEVVLESSGTMRSLHASFSNVNGTMHLRNWLLR